WFGKWGMGLLFLASIPMRFEFSPWGEGVWTNALPLSYVPGQLLARLPLAFLFLLAVAVIHAIAIAAAIAVARAAAAGWRHERTAGLRIVALTVARNRAILVVCMAIILPVGFPIVQRATLYDGIRHLLFVIPMLAVFAGLGLRALLPLLRRAPVVAAGGAGAYIGMVVMTLAALHPLEYVDMNVLVGGT